MRWWLNVCAGAQLHQLTQVGLSSRISVYPGVGRSVSGPSGSSWTQYRSDDEVSRPGNNQEAVSHRHRSNSKDQHSVNYSIWIILYELSGKNRVYWFDGVYLTEILTKILVWFIHDIEVAQWYHDQNIQEISTHYPPSKFATEIWPAYVALLL